MTDKQRRFVEEYCADFNATQAAIRAGYSERTAYAIGAENLKKPQLREAIDERLDELSMTAAEATKRLTDWGRGDFSPFLTVDATGRVGLDLSSDEARANLHLIKKIKQTEKLLLGSEDETAAIERKTEIELHDAKDAVVQMAKIRGLYGENPDGTNVNVTNAVRFYIPDNKRDDVPAAVALRMNGNGGG